MSLACRPGATFAVTLPADAALPEERRPRFTVRHLSCQEWADLAQFADDKEALQARSVKEIVSELLALLSRHVAGWSNVVDASGAAVPFSADALGQVLTLDEAWELYDAIRQQSRLSVTEKNVSTSPSASPTASSAAAGPAPVQS